MSNICLLAGDLDTLNLPDHYRMFAFGVDANLNAKRDSIQANNYVQRTLLGLANGIERMYIWAFETQWFTQIVQGDTCHIKDKTFGISFLFFYDFTNVISSLSLTFSKFNNRFVFFIITFFMLLISYIR